MNLPTLLIIAVIAVLAGIGVRSMFKRVNQGCCTERDDDHVEMVKVSDKNKAHYPHEAVLDVDGMKRRVLSWEKVGGDRNGQ